VELGTARGRHIGGHEGDISPGADGDPKSLASIAVSAATQLGKQIPDQRRFFQKERFENLGDGTQNALAVPSSPCRRGRTIDVGAYQDFAAVINR
jgi:hypothetical protein